MVSTKDKILQSLKLSLPGIRAHHDMMVPGRGLSTLIPEQAKKAAVLVLIYRKLGRLFICLIRRIDHSADQHSGQISLPGGKWEPDEAFPQATAFREAYEEVGIPRDIEYLGQLSPIYIPVSGFHVYPVVAWREDFFPFKIEPTEVNELIELELDLLCNPAIKRKFEIRRHGLILKDVPGYDIQGQIIWGATAMILSELEWILMNKTA
jgi:8-oxo-dGTP pyrophosphatase MutT (NUDIX family)